jgi:hypothetical protein
MFGNECKTALRLTRIAYQVEKLNTYNNGCKWNLKKKHDERW